MYLAPGFMVAPNSDYAGYHAYIDSALPPESPHLYGLHPNAEIEFLTKNGERVFRMVLELQPRDGSGGSGEAVSREEAMLQIIEDLLDRLPDSFNMIELGARQAPEERTPYTVVALQECERMNILIEEIRRSLRELRLGLRGELTMSTDMDTLAGHLFLDSVSSIKHCHCFYVDIILLYVYFRFRQHGNATLTRVFIHLVSGSPICCRVSRSWISGCRTSRFRVPFGSVVSSTHNPS